jgi:copper oxidase (laccase) domain-containing protein
VEAMSNHYGSRPEDLIAVIGPSICADCYEVGEETAEEFRKAFPKNWSRILIKSNKNDLTTEKCVQSSSGCKKSSNSYKQASSDCVMSLNGNNKYQCDLWAANRIVLEEAGLKPENIHVSGVCTSCNSDFLFSHRKTQGKRGSLAAFLMMKE